MREKLGFTDDMLRLLGSLKGKTLKSYDVAAEGTSYPSAYEVVGLTTGSTTIEVSWRAREMTLFGSEHEFYEFRCSDLGPAGIVATEFMFDEPRCYLVGERIVSVEVIRETDTWKLEDGVDALDLDLGLVVRTSGHTLALMFDADSLGTIPIQLLEGRNAKVILHDSLDKRVKQAIETPVVEREIIEL